MNIVVLDGYGESLGDLNWDGFDCLGNLTIYDRTAPEEVVERSRDADILLTNKVVITSEMVDRMPRLKYIGVMATGYNIVDVEALNRRGIVLTNIPAYSTMSVAQMVFAHLLHIMNNVAAHEVSVRSGDWNKAADFSYMVTPQYELAGRTMGIIGLGHIGMRVAGIARELGMNVLAYTSKSSNAIPAGVVRAGSIDDVFRDADVVTLHCPLTESTADMVCERTLALMKPTGILINTGRGGLVDEDALAAALREHRIMAAALDVLKEEPPRNGSPLIGLENCHITPHIAWSTQEARKRLMQIACDNVRAFIEGHPQNQVN